MLSIISDKPQKSVKSLKTKNGLTISSNSTKGAANITYPEGFKNLQDNVQITDITERIVRMQLIASLPEIRQINLTNQSAGLYFIRIRAAGRIYTVKAVKEQHNKNSFCLFPFKTRHHFLRNQKTSLWNRGLFWLHFMQILS